MINNKILPAHILRLYSWKLLEANTDLKQINGMIPIVPLGEEPQLADSRAPYIVYGYAEQAGTRTKEVKRGSFSMRIIARTFGQLGEYTTVLLRAFENGDVSAANVNWWSTNYPDADLVGIKFTDLDVTYVEGGDAAISEDGPMEGLINISYQYISNQTVKLYDGQNWS